MYLRGSYGSVTLSASTATSYRFRRGNSNTTYYSVTLTLTTEDVYGSASVTVYDESKNTVVAWGFERIDAGVSIQVKVYSETKGKEYTLQVGKQTTSESTS